MIIVPSFLSLAAAALYVLVALTAVYAGRTASAFSQPAWHRHVWFGTGVFFLALIAWRVFAVEDLFRAELREVLQNTSVYDARRDLQGAIVAVILLFVAVAVFFALYRLRWALRSRRDTVSVAVVVGCGAMLFLIAIRLVSFHWIDVILNGSLKVNWFADLGISLGITIAAFYYVKLVRIQR